MDKFVRQLKRHQASIAVGCMGAVTYLSLFIVFYGLMYLHNWQLRYVNRTVAITLMTWMLMTGVMRSVYGGYDIGRKKNKPVISALSLGVIVTDIITYVMLQIMNVNSNNNHQLMLFGVDFPFLLLAMVIQIALIVLMVATGNRVFFALTPPAKALLILGREELRRDAVRKLSRYPMQWHITGTVIWDGTFPEEAVRQADTIFLCGLPAPVQMSVLQQCYDLHKDVIVRAELQDIMLANAQQIVLDDAPFLQMNYGKFTFGQRIVKRLGDILVSGTVLLVFSPLLAIIALCIKLDDHGPVIFHQERMSIRGRIFRICKFRTMSVKASSAETQVSATADDARITRVGRILRRTRLDELPQMWNILRGDMTLVGPRPEMLDNVKKYKQQLPAFVYREKVKAGLTGYAQIEGRYNTSPQDKLMLDLMYIEHFSIWLDIKLLFRTLTVFFKSDSTEGFGTDED